MREVAALLTPIQDEHTVMWLVQVTAHSVVFDGGVSASNVFLDASQTKSKRGVAASRTVVSVG